MENYKPEGDCHHENIKQIEFVDYEYPTVHGPRTEVWRVKCQDCGEIFVTKYIGD